MTNLRLKWFLVWAAESAVPFVILICGPYVGLVPKSHYKRLVQLAGGIVAIVGLSVFDFFAYQREKAWRGIIERLRGEGL